MELLDTSRTDSTYSTDSLSYSGKKTERCAPRSIGGATIQDWAIGLVTCPSLLVKRSVLTLTINRSLFISYTWYMSRANIVSIQIQNVTQKRKRSKKKNIYIYIYIVKMYFDGVSLTTPHPFWLNSPGIVKSNMSITPCRSNNQTIN